MLPLRDYASTGLHAIEVDRARLARFLDLLRVPAPGTSLQRLRAPTR